PACSVILSLRLSGYVSTTSRFNTTPTTRIYTLSLHDALPISNRRDLGFEVVLLARTFDLSQWAEALEDGAFDVLDVVHGLPKAAQTVKGALWAAYLKGTGPCPEAA